MTKWIVVDIGCIECSASSFILGIFDTKAEALLEYTEKDYFFDGEQHSVKILQYPRDR